MTGHNDDQQQTMGEAFIKKIIKHKVFFSKNRMKLPQWLQEQEYTFLYARLYTWGNASIQIKVVLFNLQSNHNMQEIIESLISTKLPSQYQERINFFDKNIAQIFETLEETKPYFAKHAIINKNSIDPLDSSQAPTISDKGVIVGQLFQLINDSKPATLDKNLLFRGSCFLMTANIAVCCSHQVIQGKNYVIRIVQRNGDNAAQVINVVEVHKNSIDKNKPGQTKSEDYAFLVLKINELQQKYLANSLQKLKLTVFDDVQNLVFEFPATIYGYLENLPEQFKKPHTNELKKSQIRTNLFKLVQYWKNWTTWTRNSLIRSNGIANYWNRELSYTLSTQQGFSGAPIAMNYGNHIYVVGLHTRGSNFHSKNYGILFNSQFFEQLHRLNQRISKEKKQKHAQLNIIPLAKMVKYIQSLKDRLQKLHNQQFLGIILEKIIKKIAIFQDAELALEELKLQNVMIVNESVNDVQIDFTRLHFSDFLEKGSSDQSNLTRLIQLLQEIEKITNISIVPAQRVHQNITEHLSILDEEQTRYVLPIIEIIKKCLGDSFRTKQIYRSRSVTILLNKISFVKRHQNSLRQYFNQQLGYQFVELFSQEDQICRKEFQRIISLKGFLMNLNSIRLKFCLLHKYSKEQLSVSVIVRTYLAKLSTIHRQLQRVLKFCGQILQSKIKQNIQYTNSMKNNIKNSILLAQSDLQNVQSLKIFATIPKFTFLLKDFQEHIMVQQNQQKNKQSSKALYSELFDAEGLKVEDSILQNLAKYEYILYRNYHGVFKSFLQVRQDFFKITQQKLIDSEFISWEKDIQAIRRQDPHPLKKKQPNIKNIFNIFDMKIFQEIFIEYEHTHNNQTYKIQNLTPEQTIEYQQIIDILVEIQDNIGQPLGTGFFLDDNIICSARHIFQGKETTNITQYKIVNKSHDIIGEIQQCLTAFDKNNVTEDIIFLKVNIYQKLKSKDNFTMIYPKTKIPMIDSNSKDESGLAGSRYFALLLGLRSQDKTINLTRSFGQIDIQQNSCNPIIGEKHLSGSPIFLRTAEKDNEGKLKYKYFVVGIYTGRTIQEDLMGRMSRFRSQSFKMQDSIISNIIFPKLSLYKDRLKSSLKQCISTIYKSFDHFLLRIMGQILRLNRNSIYIPKLQVDNLLLSSNESNEILFSNTDIVVHLQSSTETQQWLKQNLIKLQIQNKCAFENVIQGLINNKPHGLFEKDDQFIKKSVILASMSSLRESKSLSDFYLNTLQGKYYFEKKSCLLEPYKSEQKTMPYVLQPQLYESKYDMIFKRMPAQYISRVTAAYNILKNVRYNIQDKVSLIASNFCTYTYFNDVSWLEDQERQDLDCDHFYYLAKKILKDGMKQIIQALNLSKDCYLSQGSQLQEKKDHYKKFLAYIWHLTNFSNRPNQALVKFIRLEEMTFDFYFSSCTNWSLIAQIMNLWNCFKI